MLARIVSSWPDANDARRLARKKFSPAFPRLDSALVCSALAERSGDDRRHSLADQDVIVLWSSGTTNITVTHRI